MTDRISALATELHRAARTARACPHRRQRIVLVDGARAQMCVVCGALLATVGPQEPER